MSVANPSNDASTTEPPVATSYTFVDSGCAPTALVPSAPREQWWHSQPVATFLSSSPAPTPLALTTVHTYPTECAERWMLSPLPTCANFAIDSIAAGNGTVFSIDPAKSIVSDPSYTSCQPFLTYSPGVCPDGHTVAEVTTSFFLYSQGTSIPFGRPAAARLGPEYSTACISHIARPLRAHALVTSVPGFADAIATPAYEYIVPTQPNSTVSNVVTVTSGLAIADPIVVGWQENDLSQFPRDYASSLSAFLAKDSNCVEAKPSSNSDSTSQSNSDALSTKSKVGIGIGAALGVLFLVLGVVILLLRKRRKRLAASKEQRASNAGDGEDHHREHWWNLGGLWKHEVPGVSSKHEMHVEHIHHEVASKANQNELDSKALENELELTAAKAELDSKSVLNELDSRAVYVVPGPPAELESPKHTEHLEGKMHQERM